MEIGYADTMARGIRSNDENCVLSCKMAHR